LGHSVLVHKVGILSRDAGAMHMHSAVRLSVCRTPILCGNG